MSNLYCAVANCSNRSDKQHNIPYHNFLKDKNLRERWGKALGREENAFCEVKCMPVRLWRTFSTKYQLTIAGAWVINRFNCHRLESDCTSLNFCLNFFAMYKDCPG